MLLPAVLLLPSLPRANAQDDGGVTPMPVGQAQLSAEQIAQAAGLIAEAITVAERNPAARVIVTRGAGALLPRLEGARRRDLTNRWIRIAMSGIVPRRVRSDAFASFFDVAARSDVEFARAIALALPDAAARAGAFVRLSEVTERANWQQADDFAMMAQQAARREPDTLARARALTFVGHRLVIVSPQRSDAAVAEASDQIRRIPPSRERDYLLAEIVGAAAKFDLALARRIAAGIAEPGLQGLATSRINLSEISQTTLMSSNSERIAALAKAAAPYDIRAVPILIQLPPEQDVLKAIADALPAVRASMRAPVSASLLERMWDYVGKAEPSSYRDQLQSRLARLMVLQDLWRGRAWGKRLAWKGGRVQVGAFLHSVAAARRSALRAEPLQDLAERNVSRAILTARALPPAARAEALLLIAGQVLG